MESRAIHQCQCLGCQAGEERTQRQHHQLNLLMSRLDEQQRRWLGAMEATKLGHGGIQRIKEVTGLDINPIRRGRGELDAGLATRPIGRIRVAGGGRKPVEKNNLDLSKY